MGLNLSKTFATDTQLETEGVWVDIGGGAAVKVVRAKSPKAIAFFKRVAQPHKTLLNTNSPQAVEKLRELQIETFANAILVDWRGVTETKDVETKDSEGAVTVKKVEVEVPYSKEAAARTLRTLPEFFAVIDELSGSAETFRRSGLEDDAGN